MDAASPRWRLIPRPGPPGNRNACLPGEAGGRPDAPDSLLPHLLGQGCVTDEVTLVIRLVTPGERAAMNMPGAREGYGTMLLELDAPQGLRDSAGLDATEAA